MNFLQLCQRARRECGIAGTGPTTVAGQTGELQRLVGWVASAWDEIQGRHPDWLWMRSGFTVNTTASDDTYEFGDCTDTEAGAAIDRFKRWWPLDDCDYSNIAIYKQSSGVGTQRWLPFLPWSNFRSLYRIGTQNAAPPAHVTIDPQNRIVLGPKPDAIYVVSGEFQRGNLALDANDDEPDMPADFHMLIVYRAMEKYGAYEAAVEVFNRGQYEGNKLMRQLELEQRPSLSLGGPLA